MAKIDLRHAYRSVPIHPSNFTATGLHWHFDGDDDFTYFYDTRLPFGVKSSPEIFYRLTQAVCRMTIRRGFTSVVVYLDDFLVIAPTQEACQLAFSPLRQLLQDLGLSISWHKVVQPTQKLVFLGVELDTTHCSWSLPDPSQQTYGTSDGRVQHPQQAPGKQEAAPTTGRQAKLGMWGRVRWTDFPKTHFGHDELHAAPDCQS